MSYLLESLKRLEEKRQGVASSDLLAVRADVRRRPRRRYVWLYVLSAALFANAGVAAVWWLVPSDKQKTDSPAVTAIVPSSPQAKVDVEEKTPSSPPADVAGKPQLSREMTKEEAKPSPQREQGSAAQAAQKVPVRETLGGKKAAIAESAPPAATAARPVKAIDSSTAGTIPKPLSPQPPKGDMAASDRSEPGKGALPELKLSLHSYSPDPPSRLVRINDRNLKEGDILVPGIKVEEILPDGVIINVEGRKMRLAVGADR
jgi:general secretion pathway protein B